MLETWKRPKSNQIAGPGTRTEAACCSVSCPQLLTVVSIQKRKQTFDCSRLVYALYSASSKARIISQHCLLPSWHAGSPTPPRSTHGLSSHNYINGRPPSSMDGARSSELLVLASSKPTKACSSPLAAFFLLSGRSPHHLASRAQHRGATAPGKVSLCLLHH